MTTRLRIRSRTDALEMPGALSYATLSCLPLVWADRLVSGATAPVSAGAVGAASLRPSLMPQRLNRVHAGGAPGREVAKQHANPR